MTYPHELEIRQWLENWHRWSPGTFGKSQWRDAPSSNVFDGAPIPVMGGEAADTQAALNRMERGERRALERYHLAPGSMTRHARALGISTRTLRRRLADAHHHFYELRWAIRQTAKAVAAGNRSTVPLTASEPARTLPGRIRLRRSKTSIKAVAD